MWRAIETGRVIGSFTTMPEKLLPKDRHSGQFSALRWATNVFQNDNSLQLLAALSCCKMFRWSVTLMSVCETSICSNSRLICSENRRHAPRKKATSFKRPIELGVECSRRILEV